MAPLTSKSVALIHARSLSAAGQTIDRRTAVYQYEWCFGSGVFLGGIADDIITELSRSPRSSLSRATLVSPIRGVQ